MHKKGQPTCKNTLAVGVGDPVATNSAGGVVPARLNFLPTVERVGAPMHRLYGSLPPSLSTTTRAPLSSSRARIA